MECWKAWLKAFESDIARRPCKSAPPRLERGSLMHQGHRWQAFKWTYRGLPRIINNKLISYISTDSTMNARICRRFKTEAGQVG